MQLPVGSGTAFSRAVAMAITSPSRQRGLQVQGRRGRGSHRYRLPRRMAPRNAGPGRGLQRNPGPKPGLRAQLAHQAAGRHRLAAAPPQGRIRAPGQSRSPRPAILRLRTVEGRHAGPAPQIHQTAPTRPARDPRHPRRGSDCCDHGLRHLRPTGPGHHTWPR